jgi:hypothetical protein
MVKNSAHQESDNNFLTMQNLRTFLALSRRRAEPLKCRKTHAAGFSAIESESRLLSAHDGRGGLSVLTGDQTDFFNVAK